MKILLVSSRFPLPPWRGNQLRTVQWLGALTGHRCALLCPAGNGAAASLGEHVELTELPGGGIGSLAGLTAAVVQGRPAQEGLYDTGEARRRLAGLLASFEPDLLVIQMVRCAWALEVAASSDRRPALLFDAIDSMGLHYGRAASTPSLLWRPVLGLEAGRCRRREAELVAEAVLTTAVCRRDLLALGAGPRGRVVPVTGGAEAPPAQDDPDRPTVLLSGNLGYRPTVRAARWFAHRVWPDLRRRVPDARWVLAGARPAPAIRALESLPGVEVHGDVDDLGAYLRRASVSVAPMSDGSGVPLKVLEAMAARVPVVADPWAAAGLADPGAVAVAENEDEWLDSVHRLLTDAAARRAATDRGLEVWRGHYHPDRVRHAIRDAVAKAAK